MKFRHIFFGTVIAMFAFAASVQAAILELTVGHTGTIEQLQSNFDLTAETGLLNNGTQDITSFDAGSTGGLQLTTTSELRFDFLGSEAAFENTFEFASSELFTNSGPTPSVVGDRTFVSSVAPGLLDFLFTTTGSAFDAENGAIGGTLEIAYAEIDDRTWIVLFGDGLGDNDHDDFAVRISAVPLPPAIWLLLSAILGLVSFGRHRRKRLQAA